VVRSRFLGGFNAGNRIARLIPARFAQIRDIALQHLHCLTIWLNSMQTLINAYCLGNNAKELEPVPELDG
jgi:hypothetical protein